MSSKSRFHISLRPSIFLSKRSKPVVVFSISVPAPAAGLVFLMPPNVPPTFGTKPEIGSGRYRWRQHRSYQRSGRLRRPAPHRSRRARQTRSDRQRPLSAVSPPAIAPPYVLGAIEKARQVGAKTLYVTCNPRENITIDIDGVAICTVVGPEVVMGSTRLKAGTATKLVLNMLDHRRHDSTRQD